MAALLFLRSLLGVMTNPAALLLIAVAFTAGDFRGAGRSTARCNAAALQSKIDTLVIDKNAAAAAATRSAADAAESAKIAAENATIIEEYRRAPKTAACTLTDDDARRLRGLR